MHINGIPACPGCEEKLKQAHPRIARWFREKVKPFHTTAHISWSFRGRTDQEKAVAQGKSERHWPYSMHNRTAADGSPCAEALDLFLQNVDGTGSWSSDFFQMLAVEVVQDGDPIRCGATWKSIGDADHFELDPRWKTLPG